MDQKRSGAFKAAIRSYDFIATDCYKCDLDFFLLAVVLKVTWGFLGDYEICFKQMSLVKRLAPHDRPIDEDEVCNF